MAWTEHYRLEFYDLHGVLWTTIFNTEDYTGEVVTLQGSGEAIVFEFLNSSDDVFDVIKPSKVQLSLIADENFSFIELYSVEEMQVWVEIYQGEESDSNLYWCGWVDPNQYQEPYEIFPYVVNVSCSDGLELLQDILYAEVVETSGGIDDITYYNGRRYKSQIVLDILGKIGHTSFMEYINVYEGRMLDTVNDSLFTQVKVDVDMYREKFCDEVLRSILPYNACIRLWKPHDTRKARFCIYRVEEIADNVVYGRLFTDYFTKSSVNFLADQFFNRANHNTNLKQVSNGNVMMTRPASKVTINQNCGYKDSWIDNWQLKGVTVNPIIAEYDFWTSVGETTHPIGYWIPGETDGLVVAGASSISPPSIGHYVGQVFGTYALLSENPSTSVFILDFDYIFYNWSGGTISNASLYLEIRSTVGGFYLYAVDETECDWKLTADYVVITEQVPNGKTEWKNYKRFIYGLPVNGTYEIRFHRAMSDGSLNLVSGIKNIKFIETSDSLSIQRTPKPTWLEYLWFGTGPGGAEEREAKKHPKIVNYLDVEEVVLKQYIVSNHINGEDKEYSYTLGDVSGTEIDNVIEQFSGALALVDIDTVEEVAANFELEHGGEYPGILVTNASNSPDIVFTENDGNDFTGTSLITNLTGDLNGSHTLTQAHVDASVQIDTILLSGSTGTAQITCNGTMRVATFRIDLPTTAQDFIDAYYNDYYDPDTLKYVQVTRLFGTLIFTEDGDHGGFSGTTQINNATGTLDGVPTSGWVNPAVPRIDTITIESDTGLGGTASITIDGVTKIATMEERHIPTLSWHTRKYNTSADEKELLHLMGDEIARQYSRPSLLLNIPIQETSGETTLNLIGNIQDDLNLNKNIIPITNVASFTKYKSFLTYRGAQPQIDKILLSGTTGACEYGTANGVKAINFTDTLEGTADAYIATHLDGNGTINSGEVYVGKEVVGANVYLVFIACVPGTAFTTVVNRTSGSLDGTVSTLQANAASSTTNTVKYIAYGADSNIQTGALSLIGGKFNSMWIKYKVHLGQNITAQVFYETSAHGRSGSYYQQATLISDAAWHVAYFDMNSLAIGSTDWRDNIITEMWFDISDKTPAVIEIEYIGFNRKFVINRGTFNVRSRNWKLDLAEITE